jgi:hypothetical protein
MGDQFPLVWVGEQRCDGVAEQVGHGRVAGAEHADQHVFQFVFAHPRAILIAGGERALVKSSPGL